LVFLCSPLALCLRGGPLAVVFVSHKHFSLG
jgi:hypothetical protein